MLANCKLRPEVDEQFHMVLEQVLEGITEMQSGQSPDLGVVRIVSALNAYGDHFQHPGWKRLE